MQLYILKMLFIRYDFDVVTAINGYEAYNYVVKSVCDYNEATQNRDPNSNSYLFDLILLDLNMPISDGFETCNKIHKLYTKNGFLKNVQGRSSPHSIERS